jgi:hydroxymethylglutaryl-CoA lyase
MANPQVTFVETSTRDGLPLIVGISSSKKIKFINKLSETGLKKIECVSFTHPHLIPEYADAERVIKGINKKPDITYVGLIPNEIGCKRAGVTAIDEVLILVSVSEYFNKMNTGKTLRETMNKAPIIFEGAREKGKTVRCLVLTAFGCPYTGKVAPEDVIKLILKLDHMGAKEISLMDSTGMANPKQVKSLVRSILDLNLRSKLAVHFHNNRNSAIANCIAAYETGIRIFDTSICGLSGPLFGVTNWINRITERDLGYWNVPTEDIAYVFEEMGINTGIDMDCLLKCAELVGKLAGKSLHGHLLRSKLLSKRMKLVNENNERGDHTKV